MMVGLLLAYLVIEGLIHLPIPQFYVNYIHYCGELTLNKSEVYSPCNLLFRNSMDRTLITLSEETRETVPSSLKDDVVIILSTLYLARRT